MLHPNAESHPSAGIGQTKIKKTSKIKNKKLKTAKKRCVDKFQVRAAPGSTWKLVEINNNQLLGVIYCLGVAFSPLFGSKRIKLKQKFDTQVQYQKKTIKISMLTWFLSTSMKQPIEKQLKATLKA